MDKEKVVVNPPKFVNDHFKNQESYHYDDIVKSFNDKYLGLNKYSNKEKSSKSTNEVPHLLLPLLVELHEAGLEEKVDHHFSTIHRSADTHPFGLGPEYIYDALESSMAPLQTPNKDNLISNPLRLKKPLKLSQLRKVLTDNPDYYKV